MDKQNNRVSFSFGMKLSLPAKYESADFHVSLTSDVEPGETTEQAFNRVKQEVLSYARKSYSAIRESDTGLEQPNNTRDVSAPADVPAIPKKTTPTDTKTLKEIIKRSFQVLEAKKLKTFEDLAVTYLGSDKEKVKKVSNLPGAIDKKIKDLDDLKTIEIFNQLKTDYKELSL